MEKKIIELSSKQKVWLSLLAASVFPFTVAVFGTGEIYLNNSEEFLFVLSDFWFVSIAIGLALFAVLAVILWFLHGRHRRHLGS
jgi:hypothetical protein